MSRPTALLTSLVLLTLLTAGSAAAESWRVRALGQWLSGSGGILPDEDFDEGYGAYLGLERRLGDRWGIEFGAGWAELESSQTIGIDFLGLSAAGHVEANLQWVPVTVAANFHLLPGDGPDLYIAPRAGFALVDDIEIETRVDISGFPSFPGIPIINFPDFEIPVQSTNLAVDDSFIYGARLGLDWPIGGGSWHLAGTIDYTVMELEFSGGGGIDLDPLTLGFGVSKGW